ncbi:hypothetical protein Phi18:2_gp03 [Cellulophaga phage phi18:2]|uniref:Uncharacterized protein n=5 Tax=Helsingorvirus TaxID=1918017 RepID=S0A171_9CAUD|nr:hypothetical protein Phi18:1_gp03 [Cellulophaga phage phi18:1]YP_008240981.1 hypothetical protein Phi12:1_gp2 [Cellulophaga phage phi12:1]YP_008241318.1 hypothetical protein Phi17:1_gp2 [Cellulophaga phage phi17:1]AGO48133.1 hypothetical protein Phi12:3_gp2 [Cellulophaga phage phi12:3]AGO49166.1 hypothetical protein Phi18:2_gp03 [Cellulophaga phage phi18:2]AGO47968.1 hypothetical protein Phi12:1_gp2 [Cellulophaga phage phi12:1]AGO48278.1 hypothetical protein Phi17:1_gp2 [Cellulophaga phage
MKFITGYKDSHILEAEKIGEEIFKKGPVHQQEMLEAIQKRLFILNKIHLRKISK